MKSEHSSIPLAKQVLAAITSVTGLGPIALHEPQFLGNEWNYLQECLNSTFVSSVGKFVDRFEADLCDFTGAKHAIAVVNGTAALHIALILGGITQGDEVLIPALTFVATGNAVKYCGAIPHFVDSEEETLGLAAKSLRKYLTEISEQRNGLCINCKTGRVIRALVPMHTFGHPSDLEGLLAISRDFNLVLIEDAAESLGSFYQNKHTGTFGLLGTLSFNGNKTITTGGGGAILTDNSLLAKRAKHLTTTAKRSHPWNFDHDEVGFNYRMPNLNAALGCAQLENLSFLVNAKRKLHAKYSFAFAKVNGVRLFTEPHGSVSNYWLQTILLNKSFEGELEPILHATNDVKIMTRPVWKLLHRLQHFQDCPKSPLPVAESLETRIVNIPSSAFLGVNYSLKVDMK